MLKITYALLATIFVVFAACPIGAWAALNDPPSTLLECEGNECDGIWTFTGTTGKARWPNNNEATADLTVVEFDADKVVIKRVDTSTSGAGVGFEATYTGKIDGKRLSGRVVWKCCGGKTASGTWSALAVSAAERVAYAPPINDPQTFEARFASLRPKFIRAWNEDECAKGESVDDYVDHWIHNFYVEGSGGIPGWFAQSATIDGRIAPGPAVGKVARRLDALGARIATEWAKPNDCRKIATFGGPPSLMAYASFLGAFLQAPVPLDLAKLNGALDELEASVDQALK